MLYEYTTVLKRQGDLFLEDRPKVVQMQQNAHALG